MSIIPFEGRTPVIADTAWIAPNATIIGNVTFGPQSSAFYGVVVRGDSAAIAIGARTNLQDNVVVHADPAFPTTIGSDVGVGHAAVVHGCTIGDGCLIGMHATILNGAVVGEGSLIAAGAVVLEGTEIPPGSLVAGVPAKVRGTLTDEQLARVRANAGTYVELAARHAAL